MGGNADFITNSRQGVKFRNQNQGQHNEIKFRYLNKKTNLTFSAR